jgi:hypothetical protein
MLLVKALAGRRFEALSWIDKLDYRFGPPIAQKQQHGRRSVSTHAIYAAFAPR